MEIKVGIGLDNIVFGMLQDEVIGILGEPDKISETENSYGIIYYFNNLLTKVGFDIEKDNKLYSIEVHHPEVVLFNTKVIGMKKSEVLNLLKAYGYSDVMHEDYETFETIFCEEIWSTFSFEFDRLTNIEFSPLYKNKDDIIWPKKL